MSVRITVQGEWGQQKKIQKGHFKEEERRKQDLLTYLTSKSKVNGIS